MNGLIASAKKIEEYGALLDCVKNTRLPIGMTGLSHIHKAHFAAALNADCGRPVLVITADEAQASRLALDMKTLGCRALLYPARDFAFRSTESQSREYEHRRLGVLDKMLRGEAQAVICSAEAASQLTLPPEELRNRTIELAVGDEMPLEDIVKALLRAGYSRSAQVDGVGQYAVRGGVLDFFTPGEEYPCRLELWGDEIDSMAYFDIETQRRTDNIEKIKITPSNEILPPDTDEFVELLERFRSEIRGKGAVKARECVDKDIDRIKGGLRLQSTDKYMPLLYDVASIFDYAKGFILCVSESFSVKERFNAAIGLMHEAMKAMFEEGELCPGLDRFSLHLSDLLNNYEQMGAIYMDNLPRGGFDTPVKELIGVNARQITAWNGSFSVLKDDLDALTDKTKRTCVIFAGTRKAADALRGDLIDDGYSALYMDELPNELAPGTLTVVPGCLSAGFEYPLAKITVFTHSGRAAVAQPKRNVRKSSNAFHSLDELHRGDYIHELNSDVEVTCFGQEFNPSTFAIAKADMMIRGGDPNNMRFGDTLSDDQFPGFTFRYCISNPPFGIDWKREKKAVEDEAAKGELGRFAPGLPKISDGQQLFVLNGLSKLAPGGKMAIIQNGSPLFAGDAGSGPSNIRQYILENDWLDAIVQLSTDQFMNTGISTYIWVLCKDKPAYRCGKVQLIDASHCYEQRRKAIGTKRNDISDHCRELIVQAYGEYRNNAVYGDKPGVYCESKIFGSEEFGYNKIVVERPQRDENGEIVMKRGKPVADTALRDTENVPLVQDIDAYFAREVLPYAPDAWIDKSKTKVGYEIPMTRYFYEYQPPEPVDDIVERIQKLEREIAYSLNTLFHKEG